MADELSAYEIKRLETIKRNEEFMRQLGLDSAAQAMSKPAPKPKAKPKAQANVSAAPKRFSRRANGLHALAEEEEEDDEMVVARDPNDVNQMTPPELRAWCTSLIDDMMASDWMASMAPDEVERVRKASWLVPFAEFTVQFGGARENSLSRVNLRTVLRQVMRLVSGAGVRSDKKEGEVFAKGRTIGLGISAAEVDRLRAEAQLWMPLHTSPADLVGYDVDGVLVPRKPASGPLDTSNGWLLNHPLMKVRLYCEHLDEIATTSLHETMRRLTGNPKWGASTNAAEPSATPTPAAEPPALPQTEASARDGAALHPAISAEMVGEIVAETGMANLSARLVREALEARLGLEKGELKDCKARISELIDLAMFGGDGRAPSPKRPCHGKSQGAEAVGTTC